MATTMTMPSTREVALRWFESLASGRVEDAIACLDPDVEWINYRILPQYNDLMPWIGTYRGVDKVVETFRIFGALVQVQSEELASLVVDGDQAAGVIHEVSLVKDTGLQFEIEFIQWLTIRGGRIVRWKSYTDPTPILRALEPLSAKAVARWAGAAAGLDWEGPSAVEI